MKTVTINKQPSGLYSGSVAIGGNVYYADNYLRWVDAWDALIKLIKDTEND